jgi:hypothetical protein
VTTDAGDPQKRFRLTDAAERSAVPVSAASHGQSDGHADGHPRVAETWIALCAQAAIEQDPKRLLDLVSEINRLLDVRRQRLANETRRTTAE